MGPHHDEGVPIQLRRVAAGAELCEWLIDTLCEPGTGDGLSDCALAAQHRLTVVLGGLNEVAGGESGARGAQACRQPALRDVGYRLFALTASQALGGFLQPLVRSTRPRYAD